MKFSHNIMVFPLIVGAAGMMAGAISERYALPIPNYRSVGKMFVSDAEIEREALRQARNILIVEEGRRNDVYLDSRGFPTVGIGHLVTPSDNLRVGQTISNERIEQLFNQDITKAFKAALTQAREIDRFNVEMIARLTSVNFQLGTGWRTKFPNTWTYIKNGQDKKAIANLVKSAWYKQTPSRATAFIVTIDRQFG